MQVVESNEELFTVFIFYLCSCLSSLSLSLSPSLPGQTPQRRDFSYPQQLAHTRPHSDLLRDFQPSATLPKLPESDTEEEAGVRRGSALIFYATVSSIKCIVMQLIYTHRCVLFPVI